MILVARTSILVALLALPALCLAPASLAATNADRAATNAYDRAVYKLAETVAADTPEAAAKAKALAQQIGQECHEILLHAPGPEGEPISKQKPSVLQRGEQARAEAQLSAIRGETLSAFTDAVRNTLVPGNSIFANTIEGLSWSDPRINEGIRQQEQEYAQKAQVPPPACGDMKSWAASGFKKLSAASRALRTEEEPGSEPEIRDSTPEPTISAHELTVLMKPYQGTVDRRLLRSAQVLFAGFDAAYRALEPTYLHLERALGLPQSSAEETESAPPIATGITEAGERYEVKVVKKHAVESSCSAEVSILTVEVEKEGRRGNTTGTRECVSRNRRGQPSSSCGGGVVGLELAVAPSVVRVRLTLSNGHAITSRVVFIPRRYGGPRGLYIQSIRGYKPYPVSVSELGRDGRVVHVLELGHDLDCHETAELAPEGPTFVPLAKGIVPDGRHFTIEDDEVRFHGETGFQLEASPGEHVAAEENEIPSSPRRAFSFSVISECEPQPSAVVYGILAAPGASVQARTSEGLVTLTKVEVPAALNSGGPLFYGAFPSLPSELVVKRGDGSVLYGESLATRDVELSEFCSGYDEPLS